MCNDRVNNPNIVYVFKLFKLGISTFTSQHDVASLQGPILWGSIFLSCPTSCQPLSLVLVSSDLLCLALHFSSFALVIIFFCAFLFLFTSFFLHFTAHLCLR